MCFFFQAEDGIRDLVRSRGLGDVYKRQELPSPSSTPGRFAAHMTTFRQLLEEFDESAKTTAAKGTRFEKFCRAYFPVSYTHLTLPTSDLV